MQLPESLPRILAGSMVVAFLVLNVVWLGVRWHPTGNDEVTHLQNTHNVATAWAEAPVRGFVESWMGRYDGEERTEWWPGGTYLFASPFVWVSSSPQAPLLALFPALFLLLLAVRRGARDLDPSLASAGAWSCWLLVLPALSLVSFRHFHPTYFVVCLATASHVALIRSRDFRDLRWSLAWGLITGLGLMSDRVTMACLVAAPLLVALVGKGDLRRRAVGAFSAASLVLVLAGPFYARWMEKWGFVLTEVDGFPETGLERLAAHARWFPEVGLGVAACLAIAIGLVRSIGLGHDRARLIWWAALLSPLSVLAKAPPAHNYIVLSLVPPLAVLAARGWARPWRSARLGAIAAIVVSVLALAGHLASGGIGRSGPLDLLAPLTDPRGPLLPATGWIASFSGTQEERTDPSYEWLNREERKAMLDFVQVKEHWSGHWLHYYSSVTGTGRDVEWTLRRRHANWSGTATFPNSPCGFESVLVVHSSDRWDSDANWTSPVGSLIPSDSENSARWTQEWMTARDKTRRCFVVDERREGPMGFTITLLRRKDGAASSAPAPPAAPQNFDPVGSEAGPRKAP